jgi:hypothetical protein
MYYGGSYFWSCGIRIINCTDPVLHNINIRPIDAYAVTTKAYHGIIFESVMGGMVSDCRILAADKCVWGKSSATRLNKDFSTVHGTEAIKISNCQFGGNIGICMDAKAYAWSIGNNEVTGANGGHILEQNYAAGLGGYHTIVGNTFDNGTTVTAGTSMVKLQRAGSVISGNTFKGQATSAQYYVRLSDEAWRCVVSNNVFRAIHTSYACIFLDNVGQATIIGNIEGENGAGLGKFVYATAGGALGTCVGNVICANISRVDVAGTMIIEHNQVL